MALSIDSHAVLRTFADHPEVYPAIQSDLPELTRKLLLKQLKAKSTDTALLRKLSQLVGIDALSIILDSMTDSEIVSLIKKVDAHSLFAKAGCDLQGARAHIVELAAGRAEIAVKPIKAAAPKKTKTAPKQAGLRATMTDPEEGTSKIGKILGSEVHSGVPRKPRKKN